MHTVFPRYQDYVSLINMRRLDGELITDQINMVIIEFSKLGSVLKKPAAEMTSLEMWSVFLRHASSPEQRQLINEMMDRRESLAMTGEILTTISQDEHERAKLRSRRMFETDLYSDLHTAEERGEIKGEKKGEKKGVGIGSEIVRLLNANVSAKDIAKQLKVTIKEVRRYEANLKNGTISIAKNLLDAGVSVEKVSMATGLSHEEVVKLSAG